MVEGFPIEARRTHPLRALRAVHPFPSLLVALLTAALVPIAGGDASPALAARLGLAMLAFQFAIGLANDAVDARDDARDKPWKPIPSGALSRGAAIAAAAAFALGGLALSAPLGVAAWSLGAAGLACGLLYDLWLKRTQVSWLPYAIAFPLLPAWVFVAADAWEPWLLWAFPLGALLGLGLHLANQAPDAATDRGLAGRLGEGHARTAASALVACAALAAAVLLLDREPVLALPVAVVAAGAAATRLLPRRPRAAQFAALAIAAAALALLFLAAA